MFCDHGLIFTHGTNHSVQRFFMQFGATALKHIFISTYPFVKVFRCPQIRGTVKLPPFQAEYQHVGFHAVDETCGITKVSEGKRERG